MLAVVTDKRHADRFTAVSEMVPKDITCAKETRDLLIDCCVGTSSLPWPRGPRYAVKRYADLASRSPEFIQLVSSEANEKCEKSAKKTIAPEHVAQALKVRRCFRLACIPQWLMCLRL